MLLPVAAAAHARWHRSVPGPHLGPAGSQANVQGLRWGSFDLHFASTIEKFLQEASNAPRALLTGLPSPGVAKAAPACLNRKSRLQLMCSSQADWWHALKRA